MKPGVYYCPKFNYLMVIYRPVPTMFADRKGIEGRVWKATIETNEGVVGRGYLHETKELVYLGDLC